MGCDLEVSSIFPFSRTLCPTSPSLQWVAWASLPHLPRYYARLRLPFAPLGVLCSRSFTDTLFALWVRVLSSSSLVVWSFPLTPGLLGHPVRLFRVAYKETNGSPKFPGYPFKFMPRSSTPVVSSALALTRSGLRPSAHLTASAFTPNCCGYPCGPQLYKFRGSITRPVLLLTLASDFRYRLCPQGSLLTCWLDFGQTGFAPVG
jgi:hypothetical protein